MIVNSTSMTVHRTIIHPQTADELVVRLPEQFLNTDIEIIAFSVEAEPQAVKQNNRTFEEAVKLWDTHAVDMTNFKFDREEANER